MNVVKGGKVFTSTGPRCVCRNNTCGGGIEEFLLVE